MCGRFALRRLPQQLLLDLKIDDVPLLEPRYNVAPTQNVAVVRESDGRRTLDMLRWGLIPAWADDPKVGARMINARSETVDTKSAFKMAFTRRRCLVLADGYYEWEAIGKRKQPYLIAIQQDRPFCMAGLWERWHGNTTARLDQPLESCTVITTESNDATADIHDRMPVILNLEESNQWLNPTTEATALKQLLHPYPQPDMTITKVSPYVNNANHEGPACTEVVRELF